MEDRKLKGLLSKLGWEWSRSASRKNPDFLFFCWHADHTILL